MNLYLDTSALIKLYVDEPGRKAITAAAHAADVVGTSVLAFVEAHAALARRRRDHALTSGVHRRARRVFRRDWPRYLRFEVDEALVAGAARLAERLSLRAFDAVHLASALVMREQLGDTVFACWDQGLARAAREAGLSVLPPRAAPPG